MAKVEPSLSLDEIMCPICLDVLIKPVTLSCDHEMCKECYDEHFEKSNFVCPMCKKRLSTWARKNAAQGTLVNSAKWLRIQEQYSDLVEHRMNGNYNEVFTNRTNISFRLANPGEVHEEYIKFKREWDDDRLLEVRKQEEASLELIQKIYDEENAELERKRKEQQERDEELARNLSKELNLKVSPSKVNRVILRPRKSLSLINSNRPECSTSRSPSRRSYTPQKNKIVIRKRKRTSSAV